MNPEYQRQLEAGVRRELESLGELAAPPALANRILQAIEARARVPWYHRSWSTWPLAWRVVSMAVLLLMFGGVCYSAWQIQHGASGWAGARIWEGWMADAAGLWRALGVLASTAASLLGRLGTGVIAAGIVLVFATWASCIALGTAYVRLALRLSVNRV